MARKPIPAATKHDDVDPVALDQGTTALVDVAGNAVQVAALMGYDLVYNRDRVVQEARFFMAQAAEAMLDAGKRLILLKEHEGHGNFIEIVEGQLGLNIRTAQLMMQAAVKYMDSPSLAANANLFSRLGKSKMFELMTLDTDVLIEFSEGGTVAGLTFDDVDRMSVRELKDALRDERANAKAKDDLLAAKSATIDKLQTKQAKLKPPTHDEEIAQLRREMSDVAFHAEGIIRGQVRDGLEQLARDAERNGTSHEEFSAGVLAQLARAIAELRGQLGIKTVPDGDPRPEWAR